MVISRAVVVAGCVLAFWVSGFAHAQQNGTVTYVYTDPQGTPLAETDAQGNITATFDYTPYGTIALGTTPNGPGYTGHVNVTLTVPYIVGVNGGSHLPMTTASINATFKQDFSGKVVLNGQTITVTAQAIEANGTNTTGHTNFLSVVPDTQGVTQSGRAETNKVGGDRVTVAATGKYTATPATVTHEFGHVSGAGDQYPGGVDAQGNVIKQGDSSQSGIMNSLNGGQANQKTMQEILQAPTNTNTCSPGAHAGNGGC